MYGVGENLDFAESVRKRGVLEPLLITSDNRVIAGHRRLEAAHKAGLIEVPVVILHLTDELDILEALVESNRQRPKTNEQIGRQAKALLVIEAERAKQRQ